MQRNKKELTAGGKTHGVVCCKAGMLYSRLVSETLQAGSSSHTCSLDGSSALRHNCSESRTGRMWVKPRSQNSFCVINSSATICFTLCQVNSLYIFNTLLAIRTQLLAFWRTIMSTLEEARISLSCFICMGSAPVILPQPDFQEHEPSRS